MDQSPSSEEVEAVSVAERISGESSDETEMFNVSMEEPLPTTADNESFVSETADGSLSCADCALKKERIENLQKLRSKQKRRNLMLQKENRNLRKVCYNKLYIPYIPYSRNLYIM